MKITIQAGTNTYLVADKTVAVDGVGCYEGRLQNQPALVRALSRVGAAPITISINIRNDDGFIPDSVDLWAADVAVVTDAGYEWHGKISAYDSDGAGILYTSVTEKSAPELTIQIPDEVARVVTVDENFHQSAINVTLPMAIGGTEAKPIALKGILIDKTQGIYLMCVGEIRQFVSIRVGETTLSIVDALAAGYLAYTGTSGQANYPGIAYVQISDAALRKNDDGTYVEIGAEVVGLKLGTHTLEECRNGARFLYWLLKTSTTGSWGLGVSESDIDLDSFTEAISRVDAAGLKLDGVFYFRQPAQSWIDQICQAIRGTYEIGENGKRRLFVNADAASVKTYTKKNVKLLRKGKGSYVGRVFNKGRLDFDYNPITGLFMQSAPYENSASIGDIEEQLFEGQSYLIRDMTTAQAILDYTCQKSQVGAAKVLFNTTELPENPRTGLIITLDYAEKALTGTWQITRLEIGKNVHTIEAEKYSSSIFSTGTPGTAIDWAYDPPVVSPVLPGQASGLSLENDVRPAPDGTNICVITGSFIPPNGKYISASIEYGEGFSPSTWISLGLVRGSSFEIAPVKPDQEYSIRIQMLTSTGASDFVTETITTEGDAVPPGAPDISATSYLKTATIQIILGSPPSDMAGFAIYRNIINDTLTAVQKGSCQSKDGRATFVDTDPLLTYGQTYYYWVKSFDTWGNLSAFSSVASTLISGVVSSDIVDGALARSALFAAGVVDAAAIAAAAVTEAKLATAAVTAVKVAEGAIETLKLADDAVTAAKLNVAGIDGTTGAVASGAVAELQLASNAVTEAKIAAAAVNTAQINNAALKNPLGAVASWSAKNCTTTSITEAGGVRDVSGNGNHGTAYGSVAVVNKAIGSAFEFSGGYVNGSTFDLGGSWSFSFWCERYDSATRGVLAFIFSSGAKFIRFFFEPTYLELDIYGGPAELGNIGATVGVNELAFFVGTYDGTYLKLYKNGALADSALVAIDPPGIGYMHLAAFASDVFSGYVAHPKMFNRELSAAEVKSLYMFPNDAAFGNITADLVTTGELITKTAQIKDAIISSAKISDLSADKINAGTLAAARIAAGSLSADKITGGALVVGGAAGDVNSGATTISGGKITASSITATQLNTDSVTSDKIQAGAVTSAKITTGELITLSAQIKDAIITDAKIEALDAAKITTGSLDAARIAAGSISAEKIAAGAITTAKLDVAAISMPAGAIADWSAKGSTTASIAVSNGVIDISGNGNHGTAIGGSSIVDAGAMGKVFSFDGSSGFVAANATLGSAWSASFWINPDSDGVHGAFTILAADGRYIRAFHHNTVVEFDVVPGEIGNLGVATPAGSWAHIVADYDGTTMRLYANGSLVAATAATIAAPGASAIYLGELYGLRLPGKIGHPKLFNRSLTLPEVVALYMLGKESETGQITADRIIAGAIDTNKLAAGAVTAAQVSAGAIETAALAAGAVTADKVAANAVTTDKLNANAVTTAKLATDAIKSTNYSTTAGSYLNLSDGTFVMGGSSDPKLSWSGSSLTVNGTIYSNAGKIADLEIKTNGLYNTTGELANSKYSVVGIHTAALDSPVNLFDMGGAGIRVLSYTAGPSLNSSVTIGAGGYFDGSTTPKAHINVCAEGTSKEAIYANGKITGYITNLSDKSIKSNFESVSVLSLFKQIEIESWEYDDEKIKRKEYEKLVERCLREKNKFPLPGTNDRFKFEEEKPDRHIGPVAGQFNQLFGFMSGSTESISLGDQIGVTMKALQELVDIVEKQAAKIDQLENSLSKQRQINI
ncbi:MAG: LamG-like jellyroll fold domain-containing protein [Candidatus Riflebacteria bacterium]